MEKALLRFMLFFVGIRQKECKSLLEKAKNADPYDAVIVPGMPFKDGVWNKAVKARLYWAKYLLENGITKKVMLSGGAVHSKYNEAIAMKLYAEAIGIPPSTILLEDKAEHSTQNAYYSYHNLRKLGFNRIAIATDPFQNKMIAKFLKEELPDLEWLPFVLDVIDELDPNMIEPKIDMTDSIDPEFIALKDREKRKERLKGTFGSEIEELYNQAYPSVEKS